VFEDMPDEIRVRMQELEAIDARDRIDGTPQARRLRQVAPEAGRLLALLAACAPAGRYLEIGTSAGYSTLWIALACRLHRRQLTTFETQSARAA
jgi:caffeoyl-CoA O-methyltransferase